MTKGAKPSRLPAPRTETAAAAAAAARRVYTAPALEKGLDVLELLARHDGPLTASAIVQRLGRSTGELFRMIQVLERRGFVEQGPEGYGLSPKLFQLGLRSPPVHNLLELALPRMRELAVDIGQSCHIGMVSGGEMVVVARMESQEQLGYSVRVGYRRPLHLTTSGLLIYAFQSEATRRRWEALLEPPLRATALATLRRTADEVRTLGHARMLSAHVDGVTDISAPVLRGDRAVAALATPFMRMKASVMAEDAVVDRIVQTAKAISAEITASDDSF